MLANRHQSKWFVILVYHLPSYVIWIPNQIIKKSAVKPAFLTKGSNNKSSHTINLWLALKSEKVHILFMDLVKLITAHWETSTSKLMQFYGYQKTLWIKTFKNPSSFKKLPNTFLHTNANARTPKTIRFQSFPLTGIVSTNSLFSVTWLIRAEKS